MTGFEPAPLAWKAAMLPLTPHPLEPPLGFQPSYRPYKGPLVADAEAWSLRWDSNPATTRTKGRSSQTRRREPLPGIEPGLHPYQGRSRANSSGEMGPQGIEPCSLGLKDRCFALKLETREERLGIEPNILRLRAACFAIKASAPGEPHTGIEPVISPWQGDALPLRQCDLSGQSGNRTPYACFVRAPLSR